MVNTKEGTPNPAGKVSYSVLRGEYSINLETPRALEVGREPRREKGQSTGLKSQIWELDAAFASWLCSFLTACCRDIYSNAVCPGFLSVNLG